MIVYRGSCRIRSRESAIIRVSGETLAVTSGRLRDKNMNAFNTDSRYRTLSPSQILSWVEDDTQIMRLRTDRDVIPYGYMAAALPGLVDWRASDLRDEAATMVLRHVNYGGNPFEQSTVLHSVRVPLDGLERA